MATITARNGSFQVKIRSGKYRNDPITFTEPTRAIAEKKAKQIEREIKDGTFVDLRQFESEYVSDLIQRYIDEVLSKKAPSTQEIEGIRLGILKEDLAHVTIRQADDEYYYTYFQSLFQRVTRQTQHRPEDEQETWSPTYVKKFTQDMMNVYKIATVVWKMKLPYDNPAKLARERLSYLGEFIEADLERDLRLTKEQYEKIRRYKGCRNNIIKYFALFQIETGMRKGETLSMVESRICWEGSYYNLESHKNDRKRVRKRTGREVPLTFRAKALLRLILWLKKNEHINGVGSMASKCYKGKRQDDEIWPWRGEHAGNTAYEGVKKIYKNLGLDGITVHDLRHEFGSRHIDAGLDIRIVGAALGHQDLKSTKRYTHPNASKIARMLDRR